MTTETHTQVTGDELARTFDEQPHEANLSGYAPEDWITLGVFWLMALAVFLQFFLSGKYLLKFSCDMRTSPLIDPVNPETSCFIPFISMALSVMTSPWNPFPQRWTHLANTRRH